MTISHMFQALFRCPRLLNTSLSFCRGSRVEGSTLDKKIDSLNTGDRLRKVLCKVNKGNKFGDFDYCSLNRGYPLNTVSA